MHLTLAARVLLLSSVTSPTTLPALYLYWMPEYLRSHLGARVKSRPSRGTAIRRDELRIIPAKYTLLTAWTGVFHACL